MGINIEGAIRGDDPRIPKAGSLDGVTVLGFLNGRVVSIDATLMDIIDVATKHLPYIGEDYYVYVWDKESQAYVKTEIYVKGEQGDVGPSNTLSIGTVVGGANASASITGTAPNQTLNLVLPKGDTGSNIELQKTATHVQWRVVGGSWSNLIALSDLKGDTGANIELQKTTTHVQWRVDGGSWANLIPLTELKGDKGDTGENAVMTIGTITTVASDAQANATVEADGLDGQGRPKFKLNLWLPRGADGEGAGDMLKSEYDSDGNGIVDNAEKVNGFTVETNVPANAKFTDTVYTHPETHPASIILQNSSHRFVSDAEKLAWNNKVDNSRVLTDVPANAKFTDTTYSEITEAEINTGTASTLRTITARRVTFILSKVSTLISNAISALTKSDVGLGNVDNTSDANKPVSTATQTALNAKIDASKFQVVAALPASPVTGVFYFIKE